MDATYIKEGDGSEKLTKIVVYDSRVTINPLSFFYFFDDGRRHEYQHAYERLLIYSYNIVIKETVLYHLVLHERF